MDGIGHRYHLFPFERFANVDAERAWSREPEGLTTALPIGSRPSRVRPTSAARGGWGRPHSAAGVRCGAPTPTAGLRTGRGASRAHLAAPCPRNATQRERAAARCASVRLALAKRAPAPGSASCAKATGNNFGKTTAAPTIRATGRVWPSPRHRWSRPSCLTSDAQCPGIDEAARGPAEIAAQMAPGR